MYDRLARYFQEMGVSEDINPLMRSAAPESMHWLTRAELAKTGMATDALAAYQIIDEANKALRPPPPPQPPPPPLPPQLSADGWVDGGRFRDKDITLIVRFTWMRGGGSIGVSATALKPASQRGITIAPVEFNVTLRPGSARERALIPRSLETAPTLFGHMTRTEFCQLRKDPMLRVAVLPGTLEGVEPRTMYVGIDGFQGMEPMLDDVCLNVETAAAAP
jgi:hypothetical protein